MNTIFRAWETKQYNTTIEWYMEAFFVDQIFINDYIKHQILNVGDTHFTYNKWYARHFFILKKWGHWNKL